MWIISSIKAIYSTIVHFTFYAIYNSIVFCISWMTYQMTYIICRILYILDYIVCYLLYIVYCTLYSRWINVYLFDTSVHNILWIMIYILYCRWYCRFYYIYDIYIYIWYIYISYYLHMRHYLLYIYYDRIRNQRSPNYSLVVTAVARRILESAGSTTGARSWWRRTWWEAEKWCGTPLGIYMCIYIYIFTWIRAENMWFHLISSDFLGFLQI